MQKSSSLASIFYCLTINTKTNTKTKTKTRRRVFMAVSNDLVTDQRVHRSCSALVEGGFDVTLVGRLLPGSAPVSRPYRTVRMRLLFRRKLFFYAEYNFRLFLRLLVARADAFYANDTDTLWACFFASRIRRKPLFFDAHELFPEVPELVGRNSVKWVWSKSEDFLFPRIAKRDNMAAVTVCQSIADIYLKRYSIRMAVVRNVPMHYNNEDDDVSNLLSAIPPRKKILLYQGAVNVGRGIDIVIKAMPFLDDCHFLIAGVGDKYDELRTMALLQGTDNVSFLGRIEPPRLHSLTKHANLGISLLENMGLNYYYSFPNRIADFVQAQVPVLATDFPEIHRIVERYGIGTLVEPAEFNPVTRTSIWPDGKEMAKIIRDAINHWDAVSREEKERVFSKAANDLNWNNDKKTLIKQFESIFDVNRC